MARRSFVIDPLDVELADLIINKVPELQAKAAERIAPLENAMARKSILHKQHMQCAALEKETQKGRSASLSPPEQFDLDFRETGCFATIYVPNEALKLKQCVVANPSPWENCASTMASVRKSLKTAMDIHRETSRLPEYAPHEKFCDSRANKYLSDRSDSDKELAAARIACLLPRVYFEKWGAFKTCYFNKGRNVDECTPLAAELVKSHQDFLFRQKQAYFMTPVKY